LFIFEIFLGKMLLSKQDLKIMIGKEEPEEEVIYKVTDRRKFNADGSLREGVELDHSKPEKSPETLEIHAASSPVEEQAAAPDTTGPGPEPAETPFEEDLDDEEIDIPGAEEPASFVNFLSTLATNAAAALGAMPHPVTGKRSLDLEGGKYWLDIMAMLREKTKGNLHPQEERLLDGILGDLRMQYVTLVRATEEKLKADAAKKFSAGDILGKKS
jgi:Domain of unknown function (DUF1844)